MPCFGLSSKTWYVEYSPACPLNCGAEAKLQFPPRRAYDLKPLDEVDVAPFSKLFTLLFALYRSMKYHVLFVVFLGFARVGRPFHLTERCWSTSSRSTAWSRPCGSTSCGRQCVSRQRRKRYRESWRRRYGSRKPSTTRYVQYDVCIYIHASAATATRMYVVIVCSCVFVDKSATAVRSSFLRPELQCSRVYCNVLQCVFRHGLWLVVLEPPALN